MINPRSLSADKSINSTVAPVPKAILVVICTMALLLNHSARVAGLNLSLADPLMALVLLLLAAMRQLIIPVFVLLFFFLVVVVSGITAMFVTPGLFGVYPDLSTLSDLVKLVVALLYIICGVGIARLGVHISALRWYAIGASLVALLSVVAEFGGRFLPDSMYYAGFRFRGFMVDPNYWAVLAASAIAFVIWDRGLRKWARFGMVLCLMASILLSGSKTGLITLAVLAVVLIFERMRRSEGSVGFNVFLLMAVVALALLWQPIMTVVAQAISEGSTTFPQLSRISILVEDPSGAISESGSARGDAWGSGLAMIGTSPWVGVGLGTYQAVNEAMFGEATVAHNTYIQIAAEWGLPLGVLFFGWLASLLLRASMRERSTVGDILVVRNMVITFLAGSFSLSLNNARMFWLFLGILIFLVLDRARNSTGADPSHRLFEPALSDGGAPAFRDLSRGSGPA